MLGPAVEEDAPEHRPAEAGGTLEATAASASSELADALGRPTPFDELARRFGRLAHFVADAGYPPAHGTDGDAERRYRHFAGYCNGRLDRIPLVFYGLADGDLDAGFSSFLARIDAAAAGRDRDLARIYLAAGDPPDPSAFDDRSVPFAVCSLAYTQTVTDVVRAWLSAWLAAGGDARRTPYAATHRRVIEAAGGVPE
jgi:hypothetical protein